MSDEILEEPNKELLQKVRSEFNKLSQVEQMFTQFCFECCEVASYADVSECAKCHTKYNIKDCDKCPNCESYDSYEFCDKCGAFMVAQYVGERLEDDDFEWSDNELNVILKYIEERLKEK